MSLAVDERRHPSAIRRSEDLQVRLTVAIGGAGFDGEEVVEPYAKDGGGRAGDLQVRALDRGCLCQPVERLRVDRKAKALLDLPLQLGNCEVPFLEQCREPWVDHHAHPAASSVPV